MLFLRMPLCATKCSPLVLVLGLAAASSLAARVTAQQVPQRPSNVTDQQLQQYVQQAGIGDQIRQRIQDSGLTPDQIRARLRAAGYPENLVDQYMTPATAGQAAPAPTADMLRAVSILGLGGFVSFGDTTAIHRDSIFLTRDDSLLLDSLGFRTGVDSIPTRRDTLGFRRLDSLATIRLAERLRRPRVFGLDVFRRSTTQFNPLA